MKMSQAKMKQLIKLLKEWSDEFAPKPNYADVMTREQPLYGEVLRLIISQITRELDKPL